MGSLPQVKTKSSHKTVFSFYLLLDSGMLLPFIGSRIKKAILSRKQNVAFNPP